MNELDHLFEELRPICGSGYHFAFHFRYSRPSIVRSSYSIDWARHYAIHKFVLADPTVVWGLTHTGTCRWSQIRCPDPLNVLGEAAQHGYRYGAAFSTGPAESRSLGSCARPDREFTDAEIASVFDIFARIHALVAQLPGLKSHQQEVLQLLEAGLTYDQICAELGLSRTAVVNRLKGARRALGVATNAEAIRIGVERGFLTSTSVTGVTKGLPYG
ncbi:autoinducer binding domain-containing protein [Pseudooceanicola sp.]|jgi:LuxR family transcriptional regulator|uniref:autoinducer binding domain-containing protein n=1 Tax=Pseudooceanicola sp. TaxID=1914328 RepID=UPI004059F5D7